MSAKKIRKRGYKGRYLILTSLLLALCVLLLRSCGVLKQPSPLVAYEEKVNEITEIDYSEQQDALNAIVEEGKMNVNYSSKAIFDGKMSESFNIKNIQNNHHPIVFELLDESGECIYLSKRIAPGYEMNSIELEKELPAGEHECKLKVGYVEEGNVSSVFPITIEVK